MKKKVFVVGLDDFNLIKLNRLPAAADCVFFPALKFSEMRGIREISIPRLLDICDIRINEKGGIDAIVSYFDFPGSVLVPIIAGKYSLPAPSLQGVIKCEHKYWSRIEQAKVVPENIPQFRLFNPNDDQAYEKIGFDPPFWVKPVKSYHSFLAFRISGPGQFRTCMKRIGRMIDYIDRPFRHILEKYGIKSEFELTDDKMLAETLIDGHQCTAEGFVYNGEVKVYGIVDCIRADGCPSVIKYLYPSSLPQEARIKISEVAGSAVGQTGLDNCAFNIDIFYNFSENKPFILEINPRISQAFTDIFEKVHGISHQDIMLNLALNRRPAELGNNGHFKIAGHFLIRAFKPGKVKQVPSATEILKLKKKYPELVIFVNVREGLDLRTMAIHHTDSYSYILADIFLGAEDMEQLNEKYHDVTSNITFAIE